MQKQSLNRPLILASSSPYRKELLARLVLPFSVASPDLDETALDGETPAAMVARLAAEKAGLIAARQTGAVVIGSDQVAVCEGRIVGKPGNSENAVRQLLGFSGKSIEFLTAICVVCLDSGFSADASVSTIACFRALQEDEIRRYVDIDRPFDCAGGFKAESAGVTLLERLDSEDPTAIIGLPLIRLSGLLRDAGYRLP